MPANKNTITPHREDISRFVVHLTRDDNKDFSGGGGGTGIQNLEAILSSRKVLAARSHCLHKQRLTKEIPKHIRDAFKVACFTEVPLSQIHLLTQPIQGVDHQREPYGLVFDRRTLIDAGAQPAIYVNSYGGTSEVKSSFNTIFDNAKAAKWCDDSWRVLPYVNAMHEGYDFTWEREWRACNDFTFRLADVVAIILPASGADETRKRGASLGIPCISPGWTYEMIVAQLSRQQRTTRQFWKAKQAVAPQKSGD